MGSRFLKPIWTVLNLILLTGLIYFGVRSVYALATAELTGALPPPPPSAPEETTGPAIRSQPPAIQQYSAIAERNLFKTSDETQQVPEPEVEKPPEPKEPEPTRLNLTLMGTVTGPTALAYAIIEDGKAKAQSLKKIGDGIQDAVIKEIHGDHVLLDVNGRDEILKLEAFRTEGGGRRTGGQSPAQAVRQTAGSAGGDRITVGQDKIESAVKNVNTLMKQVRIRPHFRDGKPDGLLLTGIRPGSIFSDMGLKSGDIITGVDENPIESLDDALKFYQSLKSAKDVKLEIRRRGQPRTIDYTIEQP